MYRVFYITESLYLRRQFYTIDEANQYLDMLLPWHRGTVVRDEFEIIEIKE